MRHRLMGSLVLMLIIPTLVFAQSPFMRASLFQQRYLTSKQKPLWFNFNGILG